MGLNTADQFAALNVEENVITLDRRSGDRRSSTPESLNSGVAKTSRRKKQRRRHIDPTTCERDYSEQELEFMRAMDEYKRDSGRMFPTCSEVLEVIRGLGYVQLNDEQIEKFGLVEASQPAGEAVDYSDSDASLSEV
jgi:hypothetical protein